MMHVHEIEAFAEELSSKYRDFSALESDSQDLELPSPEAVKNLLTTAAKLYTARQQRGEQHEPIHADLGPTEVVTTVSAILDAAELDVFELTMWRGLTGA